MKRRIEWKKSNGFGVGSEFDLSFFDCQCDLEQDANRLSEPECQQCLPRIVLVYISSGDPEKSFWSSRV